MKKFCLLSAAFLLTALFAAEIPVRAAVIKDKYEPNNTRAQAKDITNLIKYIHNADNEDGQNILSAAHSTRADVDWYKIKIPDPTHTYYISLMPAYYDGENHSSVQSKVDIFTSGEKRIGSFDLNCDHNGVVLNKAQYVYLKLYSKEKGNYNDEIYFYDCGAINNDVYEPNNSLTQAARLEFNTGNITVQGTIYNDDDDDYYYIDLPMGSSYKIILNVNSGAINVRCPNADDANAAQFKKLGMCKVQYLNPDEDNGDGFITNAEYNVPNGGRFYIKIDNNSSSDDYQGLPGPYKVTCSITGQ